MTRKDAHPLVSRTPWRQLYRLYRGVLILFRLPTWVFLSAVPYTRQHPKWTFKQSLTLRLTYDVVDTQSQVGVTDQLSLSPGKEGDRFESIAPFPEEFYQGPLISSAVAPAKTGGTWFPGRPEKPDGTVVLWIHGGAFVLFDGRSDMCSYMANNLLQLAGVDAVLSLQYRLSGYEALNPFPAALQDVVTAYLHLTQTLKISPDSIVVGGDSAGGNLTIAFLRYLEEVMPHLGRPSAAAVVSPWVVPLKTLTPGYVHASQQNHSTDYLPASFLQWGGRAYQPREATNEVVQKYITPLGHPFATTVPILSTFGECEILAPDIVAWTAEMRSIPPNNVEIHCDENGVHDALIPGDQVGWGESAKDITLQIGNLIRNTRKASTT